MAPKLIYGKLLTDKLHSYVKDQLKNVTNSIVPHLAIVQVGSNPMSNMYIKTKINLSKSLSFKCSHIKLSDLADEAQIVEHIESLNTDDSVHGILLQLPLESEARPDPLNCLGRISNQKDIEGLNHYHHALLSHGRFDEVFVPCTAAASLSIISLAGWNVKGLIVTVIGSGITAGRPIANLLSAYGATVTICHWGTKDLQQQVRDSDLVVSCAGKPLLVKASWLKPGAAVIDCGVHRINDKTLVGDVDVTSCSDKISWLTPVPGGMGPATTSWLFFNLFEGFRRSVGLNPLVFSKQFSTYMQQSPNELTQTNYEYKSNYVS